MKLGHKHESTNTFFATSTDPQRFVPVDPKTLISSISTETHSNRLLSNNAQPHVRNNALSVSVGVSMCRCVWFWFCGGPFCVVGLWSLLLHNGPWVWGKRVGTGLNEIHFRPVCAQVEPSQHRRILVRVLSVQRAHSKNNYYKCYSRDTVWQNNYNTKQMILTLK